MNTMSRLACVVAACLVSACSAPPTGDPPATDVSNASPEPASLASPPVLSGQPVAVLVLDGPLPNPPPVMAEPDEPKPIEPEPDPPTEPPVDPDPDPDPVPDPEPDPDPDPDPEPGDGEPVWPPGLVPPPEPPPLGVDTETCRPVAHAWVATSEPLRLPCEPTTEPCDGIDNDQDGFLDPHCPTVACASDADCTFWGLLPDADCNHWEEAGPGCNQIDGVPFGEETQLCQGMLCPPGLKCVAGDCLEPGHLAPDEACTSGEQCPAHAGCIPDSPGLDATAVCVTYCHDVSCPTGYSCILEANVSKGIEVSHEVCTLLWGCEDALTVCEVETSACAADPDCVSTFECLSGCDGVEPEECLYGCTEGEVSDTLMSAIECVMLACPI